MDGHYKYTTEKFVGSFIGKSNLNISFKSFIRNVEFFLDNLVSNVFRDRDIYKRFASPELKKNKELLEYLLNYYINVDSYY